MRESGGGEGRDEGGNNTLTQGCSCRSCSSASRLAACPRRAGRRWVGSSSPGCGGRGGGCRSSQSPGGGARTPADEQGEGGGKRGSACSKVVRGPRRQHSRMRGRPQVGPPRQRGAARRAAPREPRDRGKVALPTVCPPRSPSESEREREPVLRAPAGLPVRARAPHRAENLSTPCAPTSRSGRARAAPRGAAGRRMPATFPASSLSHLRGPCHEVAGVAEDLAQHVAEVPEEHDVGIVEVGGQRGEPRDAVVGVGHLRRRSDIEDVRALLRPFRARSTPLHTAGRSRAPGWTGDVNRRRQSGGESARRLG